MPRKLRHHKQISSSHCGPAVLQILLENIGITASQKEITKLAGAESTIKKSGTNIYQLSAAVSELTDRFSLYYKFRSGVSDIKKLLETGFPVGVEWQGIFEEEDEDGDGDFGHYSIVSNVDLEKKLLIIVDPYKDFAHSERILGIDEFTDRWWDTNEVADPVTGKKTDKKDERLAFVISGKNNKDLFKMGFASSGIA